MFKSKKPKINAQNLDELVRRQRLRKAVLMTKLNAQISVGIMSLQ
jgi:hypothetical protein